MTIVCVLAASGVCGEVAAAATKHDSKRQGSKKHGSAARQCPGANSAAVDEASRRRAARVVLCLVNRKRRAHRVRPLRRSAPLQRAAAQHSAAMVGGKYFSHVGSSGSVLQRAMRTGYVRRSRYALLGETLSWGAGPEATPAQLVASFMGSRSHRRTLLSRRYRDVGIGLALGAPATDVAGSAATLTLNFGRR